MVHEHNPIYSLSMYAPFSGQLFFKFSEKKIVIGKKDRCAVFRFNNDRLFLENYTMKFSFCPKNARKINTERVPPGHPVILLKSNKFNTAAVSVKRSTVMHFFVVLNRILI